MCNTKLTNEEKTIAMSLRQGVMYAIVCVEITEEGKAPDLKYVTVIRISPNSKTTEAELKDLAVFYLRQISGDKKALWVMYIDEESYLKYLKVQFADFLSNEIIYDNKEK